MRIVSFLRFLRKRSSRPKMNPNNIYRGGLIANPFAGFSPPKYTLYKFIFTRLLFFCENLQIHMLTRVSGLQTKNIHGNAIPSPRWANSDFFTYRRKTISIFFYISKKDGLSPPGRRHGFPWVFYGFV